MPITRTPLTTGGQYVPPPWVGSLEHRVAIPVALSGLTNKEIDANGYVKPGVPLRANGTLVSGAAQVIMGVTVDYVKVANDNAAGTIAALGTVDLVIGTIGQVNQDVIEDILERVLTANELTAFAAAGGHVVLL